MCALYFNTSTGEHAEFEYPPEELDASASWKSLAELIVSQEVETEGLDFRAPVRHYWDDGQVRRLGTLVAKELAELDPPVGLTTSIVQRLHYLGLFPSKHYFRSRNGRHHGLVAFREVIDAASLVNIQHYKRNAEYATLDIADFADLILARYNQLVGMPDGEEFDGPISTNIIHNMNLMELAPGIKFINKNFGGLRQLNEHLGFPDVTSFDEHDYCLYGADVIRYNGLDALTGNNINILSARHLGPHAKTIDQVLGWSRFKDLALEEYNRQRAIEESHANTVKQYYAQHVKNPDPEATLAEMARHRALWILIGHFKPTARISLPPRPDMDDVQNIFQKLSNINLSLGEIETSADILNISDDLWTPVQHFKPPILKLKPSLS